MAAARSHQPANHRVKVRTVTLQMTTDAPSHLQEVGFPMSAANRPSVCRSPTLGKVNMLLSVVFTVLFSYFSVYFSPTASDSSERQKAPILPPLLPPPPLPPVAQTAVMKTLQ